jgi:IS5 family transposase
VEAIVPWPRIEALIDPVYLKKGNDLLPMSLCSILRIRLMQQWFDYFDLAMENVSYEIPMLHQYTGLEDFEDSMPNESTSLLFRHLLEQHEMVLAIFGEVNGVRSEKRLRRIAALW